MEKLGSRSHRLPALVFSLATLLAFSTTGGAQGVERSARAAQWDSYQFPAGEFIRFVDKQSGLSFWHPADWKESKGSNGSFVFRPALQGANMIVTVENIPEGLGVASYASSVRQSFRGESVKPDSTTVRRVMMGGLEWREIAHEIQSPGGAMVHQTIWLATAGPRAYGFTLNVETGELEKQEPVFKRMVSSARIGAAGHWDREYETLRANLAPVAQSGASHEVEAVAIAEDLRTGRESFAKSVDRIHELFSKSPDAALDLVTDTDPQVRTAAISALGKSSQAWSADALIWALSDNDVHAGTAAAQGLAARGPSALAAVKDRLPALAGTPSAIIRAGVAFGEDASRELIDALMRGDESKQHLAGLLLAITLQQSDLRLPWSKLIAANDLGVLHATIAVLARHRPVDAASEIARLLGGEHELWAARALGEIAPGRTVQDLQKRIAEIDARLSALGKPATGGGQAGTKKSAGGRDDSKEQKERPSLATSAELKSKPEDLRLALLRGELDSSKRKIEFRDRWDRAKNDAERRAIDSEINKGHSDLKDWADISLLRISDKSAAVADLDPAKLKDAPTTGETLFPKETYSYVLAPDFAGTIERLDSALSGVQMATVRDQMTLALILKSLKARLSSSLGVDVAGDAGKATGMDLKSPIALASWKATENPEAGISHSAALVRVTDRARFGRLLAIYQDSLGDFDQFFTVTAALARFAGIIPAAAPAIYASIASDEARGNVTRRSRSLHSKIPSLKPFSYVRRDRIGATPVDIIVRPHVDESGGVRWENIYLAYLGDTAIVAPTRAAIADLLKTGMSGQTLSQNETYLKARAEKGEIVFFSQLDALLKPLSEFADSKEEGDQIAAFVKAFRFESGALQLSDTSWETLFKIGLADNEITKSFRPFKVEDLSAPRELIPRSTILYAGTMIDPPKMLQVLKSLETESDRKKRETDPREKEIEAAIEKLIVPNLQGEIAAALISLKPIFDDAAWPAMALALKLKNNALAEEHRARRLFPSFPRVPNATALGSPVAAMGKDAGSPYLAVSGDYLILADSVGTLRLLESEERFYSSRDFARSARDVPGNLALFATYSLESAFDEASRMIKDGSSQQMLPFVSAIIHAFHSQRAYVTIDKDGLTGRLAVAFDREGRYSVGDLAIRSGEFDVANAIIVPTGLTVIQSPLVNSITLRVAAGRPGVAPRLRNDLAKFDFQRVESADDNSVVVTATSRRIPGTQTVQLPVTGAEFAAYLNPTARINSKDPQVVSLAREITGSDTDGRSVATKIGEWTYRNLKWKKVENDTVETVASREADCLEHSELYVALARASGLPARVVTGAALSGGSFGAHAWVEVHLGKWYEIDPTWGLMDHVDATHLRFDGDAFISYAMLNQLQIEITGAQRTVADFQKDPIRLVREFSLDKSTRDLAFDLSLVVEQSIGAAAWAGLDEKQRAAAINAFEKTVSGMWETWDDEAPAQVRVLTREIDKDRAVFTVLRGEALLRLTLRQRQGAWFITEHEIVDDALPEFADATREALNPGRGRGIVFEMPIDKAEKYINGLLAGEGDRPDLLLLKSRVISFIQVEEILKGLSQPDPKKPEEKPKQQAHDPVVEILKKLTETWPDFAPGHLALARELLYSSGSEDAVNPLSKDAERAIAALHRYANLAPYDPRPWRDLAYAHEMFDELSDAEAALRKSIALDPEYPDHHAALVIFLLQNDRPEKSRIAFANMLKVAPDADEAFARLDDEEGFDPDYAKALEQLILAFPKELSVSKAGLILLTEAQEAQNKVAEAIKTMQRAVTIEPGADDYEYLSRLYRQLQRFMEALNAANHAIKLDEESAIAHFERACSLAQLGRKRESLAALKLMFELDAESDFDLDDPDLQPLATMPEFKAMKEKSKEGTPAQEGARDDAKPHAQQENPNKQKKP
jgi:transglutaminase-like putative cysteine protease/tetratricopeptide (TPR) repeat protein